MWKATIQRQALSIIIMTQYLTQSDYPDTNLTSSCPIPIMPITWLRRDKYQFYKLSDWLDRDPNSQSPTCETCALPSRHPCPIFSFNVGARLGCECGVGWCGYGEGESESADCWIGSGRPTQIEYPIRLSHFCIDGLPHKWAFYSLPLMDPRSFR